MKNQLNVKGFCDLHTHSISSGHAYSTVTEIANHAKSIGLSGIAITDHSPGLSESTHIFHFHGLRQLPDYISGIRVFKGIEANIINKHGEIDMRIDILKTLDVVIASIHPPTFDYINIKDATETYMNAMENKYINIIGHPDDSRMLFNRDEVVKKAKKTNTLLELNASSLAPNSYRQNARGLCAQTLKACMKFDTPIALNSDAHFHESVGGFKYAFELIDQLNFPVELIVNRTLETTYEFLGR